MSIEKEHSKQLLIFAMAGDLDGVKQLPEAGDLKGMAAYWNEKYNRNDKHGTDKQFIDNFRKYCK